jgi:hypothetical protein
MNAAHQANREAKRLARLKFAHVEHVKQGHLTLDKGKAVIQVSEPTLVERITSILRGLNWKGPIVCR